jgi:hypothetical protein
MSVAAAAPSIHRDMKPSVRFGGTGRRLPAWSASGFINGRKAGKFRPAALNAP